MQSELINQIKSAEFYCIVLFLYTIISNKKGICHITVDLFLLYFLSSFSFLGKKECEVELVGDKFQQLQQEEELPLFFLFKVFLNRSNVTYSCKP